ncbi:M24 family metallopeptidase [Thermodesulfobacteriota bacterium]
MIKEAKRTFYEKPRFPDIPHNEWKTRIEKARRLMAANGIDCLVLWARENIRYFFGFMTIHWQVKSLQPAVGIIPADGEAIIVVPELFKGNAEGLCWVENIWTQSDPIKVKSHREFPKDIAEIIKAIGYGDKNIALEMGPYGGMWIPRPLNDIDLFRTELPKAAFVDGDGIIWDCRMVKSPLEIERIKTSISRVAKIEKAIVERYRPGMMEEDLMKIINLEKAEQSGGCLGDDSMGDEHLICSAEKYPFADIKAFEGATIGKRDAIQLVVSLPYKGYTPDNTRRWQVGPVRSEVMKLYEILWQAQDNAEAMLRPGVKVNEVYERMFQFVDEGKTAMPAGTEASTHRGHGTGLDLQEPPFIDPYNERVIEEGMTLSIEPWINQEKGSFFGIGDTFVVTSAGCEKIEGLCRDIIQVSNPW